MTGIREYLFCNVDIPKIPDNTHLVLQVSTSLTSSNNIFLLLPKENEITIFSTFYEKNLFEIKIVWNPSSQFYIHGPPLSEDVFSAILTILVIMLLWVIFYTLMDFLWRNFTLKKGIQRNMQTLYVAFKMGFSSSRIHVYCKLGNILKISFV